MVSALGSGYATRGEEIAFSTEPTRAPEAPRLRQQPFGVDQPAQQRLEELTTTAPEVAPALEAALLEQLQQDQVLLEQLQQSRTQGLVYGMVSGVCVVLSFVLLVAGTHLCVEHCRGEKSLRDHCCGRRAPPASTYDVLVCIQGLEIEGPDPTAEYVVWALTRRAGDGAKEPDSRSCAAQSVTQRLRFAPVFPQNLALAVPAEERADIQLAVYRELPASAVARAARRAPERQYVGAVSLEASRDLLATRKLHDHAYAVKSPDGSTVGSLVASFYTVPEESAEVVAWAAERLGAAPPLSCCCLLDLAVAAVRAEDRGPLEPEAEPASPEAQLSQTCQQALARVLTGNLRFGMKSGAVELKYTEMKKQETPRTGQLSWLWVWYENPEEPAAGRPSVDNLMEGYVALRALQAVEPIPESDALALRHDSDGGQPVELVIHRGNTNAGFFDCLRGRDELVFALRLMRAELLRTTGHGAVDDAPFPPSREDSQSHASARSPRSSVGEPRTPETPGRDPGFGGPLRPQRSAGSASSLHSIALS